MKQILIFLFIIVGLSVFSQNQNSQNDAELKSPLKSKPTNRIYTYKIVHSKNDTWCYDIYKDKKVLIHQTSIPALPGNKGFKTKSDAAKVARLVIRKLKNGEMPPSVSLDEMEKLNILSPK